MYFNDLNLNTDKRGYLKIEDTDVQTAIERYNSERFVKARSSIRIRECASNVLTARIKIYLSIRDPVTIISVLHLGEDGSYETHLQTKFTFIPRAAEFIPVNMHTTASDVIQFLINQFNIQEQPNNFNLFEKSLEFNEEGRCIEKFRKMKNNENPLQVLLYWTSRKIHTSRRFVLCDFNPSEESQREYLENLSYEELQEMLASVNKDEEIALNQIKEKYFRNKLLHSRALSTKRLGTSISNSCPNISRALGSQTTGMEKEFKMDKSILLSRQKSRTLQHNMKKKPKNSNSNTLKCSIQ